MLFFMEKLKTCDSLTLMWIFIHMKSEIFSIKLLIETNYIKSNIYNSIVQVGFI